MLAHFATLRVEDEKVRHWIANALRARTRDKQEQTADEIADLTRQINTLRSQQDQLLNLRLLEEIDEQTFAAKSTEFRDRIAQLSLQIDAQQRSKDENSDVVVKAFELSQTLQQKWLTADMRAKRQLLEIMCLNLTLDGVSLVPEWRKPFDMLAEGLLSDDSRGDWI